MCCPRTTTRTSYAGSCERYHSDLYMIEGLKRPYRRPKVLKRPLVLKADNLDVQVGRAARCRAIQSHLGVGPRHGAGERLQAPCGVHAPVTRLVVRIRSARDGRLVREQRGGAGRRPVELLEIDLTPAGPWRRNASDVDALSRCGTRGSGRPSAGSKCGRASRGPASSCDSTAYHPPSRRSSTPTSGCLRRTCRRSATEAFPSSPSASSSASRAATTSAPTAGRSSAALREPGSGRHATHRW